MSDPTAGGGLAAEIVEALRTSDGCKIARDGVKSMIKGRKPAVACEAAG